MQSHTLASNPFRDLFQGMFCVNDLTTLGAHWKQLCDEALHDLSTYTPYKCVRIRLS